MNFYMFKFGNSTCGRSPILSGLDNYFECMIRSNEKIIDLTFVKLEHFSSHVCDLGIEMFLAIRRFRLEMKCVEPLSIHLICIDLVFK